MSERYWKSCPTSMWRERWVFVRAGHEEQSDGSDPRILRRHGNDEWIVRFDGRAEDGTRHRLPAEMSAEDAKAAAAVLWRLK